MLSCVCGCGVDARTNGWYCFGGGDDELSGSLCLRSVRSHKQSCRGIKFNGERAMASRVLASARMVAWLPAYKTICNILHALAVAHGRIATERVRCLIVR